MMISHEALVGLFESNELRIRRLFGIWVPLDIYKGHIFFVQSMRGNQTL